MQGYNPYKRKNLIAAALAAVLLASGCQPNSPDWDDALPAAATDKTRPAVEYETEETTPPTETVTFETTESTKRTAATESTPELATTTTLSGTAKSASEEDTASTIPDIPNVPISEFTSTTPLNLADAATSTASETSPAAQSDGSSQGQTSSSSGSSGVLGTTTAAGTSASSGSGVLGTTAGTSSSSSSGAVSETTGTISTITDIRTASNINRPYSYRYLTEKQKYIYDAIIDAAENCKTTINFPSDMDITSEDYCGVYQIIYDDEHALFHIDTKMQYAVNSVTKKIANSTVFYKYPKEETEKMRLEIDGEVNKILAKITPGMTDYDKVKLFHDELASTVIYDENAGNCRDIYGVFVDRKAICGGFSKAFSYLCGKVGIETATVTGDADGQPHMWNKVKIGEKWYNIDVTYAVSNSSAGSYVRYDYFCVPDKMLETSRTVYEQPYKYPEALWDDMSYFAMNKLVAESWTEARIILRDGIIAAAKNKETLVQVQCADRDVYEETVRCLFNEKQALDIYEEALEDAANKFDCDVVNYNQDSTSLVIKLFLEYI